MHGVFFLVGPTAVGKTTIAVDVAEQIGAEIINADAFQTYRGLDILTAKPSICLQRRIRHHLVSWVEPGESMSAAIFRELALTALEDVSHRGKRGIVVGGSGLYIKALTHGFNQVGPPDPELRKQLEELTAEQLIERLRTLDPERAEQVDLRNRRRVIRAIEIASVMPSQVEGSACVQKRGPLSSLVSARADSNAPLSRGAVLVRDREDLYQRINQRVAAMFEQGVEQEVRDLANIGQTAAAAIGLSEIQRLLAGEISRPECIRLIQQATRRYARRQLTWFRHQTNFPQLNLTEISHQEAVSAITRMVTSAAE